MSVCLHHVSVELDIFKIKHLQELSDPRFSPQVLSVDYLSPGSCGASSDTHFRSLSGFPISSLTLALSLVFICSPAETSALLQLLSISTPPLLERAHLLICPSPSATRLCSPSSQRSACFCSSCRNACFSISFLNSPCLLPSSSVCWPHSAMRRWSSTATAFAFWMVDRR